MAGLAALLLFATADSSRAGAVLKLYYDGITGTAVSDLTSAATFPSSPNAIGTQPLLTGLQESLNFDDIFGAWTRGFIEAPQDGQYTFWIASDDNAEFWLSTDANPANKVKIAENIGAVGNQSYTDKPAQKSALITLQKGQKYYFEMLHKDGTGADHCSVAWTLPDSTFEAPVPDKHLWPFPVDLGDAAYPPVNKAAAILTDYVGLPVTTLPPSINVEEGRPVVMTVTAEATQPAYVQWFSNNIPIPGANLLSYEISAVSVSQNNANYSVTVTNSLGNSSASTTLFVAADTTAPTLVDALNLGNPGGIIAVVFSEAVDSVTGATPGNYTLNNGATVTAARIGSTPNTVLLTTSGLTVGPAYTLTVNNVRDQAGTPNTIAPGSTVAVEQALHTWMRLDENSGTAANDSSGNGRHGTLESGAAAGHVGQVLRSVFFDSVNDHVRLPATGYDDFTSGLTIALWARPVTAGLWARFVEFGNAPASDNILFARNGTSEIITFEVYQGGATSGKVDALGAIVQDEWQHFVATMDSTGSTIIYRNGTALVTNVTGVPNVVARTNNFLGRSNWGGDGYYGGWMDDVRVYNRVLSAEAIQALAAGAGADDDDPVLPTVTVAATVPTTALISAPPGVFTISRTGSTAAALTVQYTLGGTAGNGVSYTNLPTSVIIPSGASSVQVFVQPISGSFTEIQQTVILSVAPTVNYNIGNPAAGTVTIFNNSVSPTPLLATARINTVEVWFAAPVTLPSATTPGNYTFNPALTVTNAVLDSRSLRVVLNLAEEVPSGTLVTVSGVQDPGGFSETKQLPVHLYLNNAVNLVAGAYNSPAGRANCFPLATNGVVDNVNNSGGFDTFNTVGTDFAGLLYGSSFEMYAVKVDLGNQFGDGGSWASQPKLYRLKVPADTSTTVPEFEGHTNLWEEVPAAMISGSQFSAAGDGNPSPNTPIVFSLANVPANQRTGFGWAVGGVLADNTQTFLSITELSAFGVPGTLPPVQALEATPSNFNVAAGQRAKLKVYTTMPATFQWQKDGLDLPGETKGYYALPPVTPADNNSVYGVVLTVGGVFYTNITATLTVIPRATPAVVREAFIDYSNSLVHVWFDEYVEPASATTLGNYTLNDGALTVVGAVQDAQGYRVQLNYSGTPLLPDLTVTVSGVQDVSGNIMSPQVVPLVGISAPASRVVANIYQQGRAAALTRSTDNIIMNDANVTTWTTAGGGVFGAPSATDFVGLGYAEPQVWNAVEMHLGWQFGDGGDWSRTPRVFIQKTPVDTNQQWPETDTNNWVEVPAVLMSANVFDGELAVPTGTTPLPNNVIAFDLSHLPLSQRTGYGWAIGGVWGNSFPGQARFVTISELRGYGVAADEFDGTGAPVFALDIQQPVVSKLAGAPLTFVTSVIGGEPIYYEWRHNGTPLTESGRISGVNSSVLTIAEIFPADAGTYQLIATNAAGSNASVLATVTVTPGIPSLNNGINWTRSGGATVTGDLLQLTTALNQGMSAFLNDRFYIGAFRATFTYQDVGGGGADGTTFVLQNAPAGPAALGGAGGQLGYATGITPSVALIMNIYGGAAGGVGYSLGINGALNTPYQSTAPVSFASGNPIDVEVSYDGDIISLSLTDTVTAANFTTNAPLDIPAIVGGERAYVGFTAASGGIASNQQISDFQFTSLPALTIHRTSTNTIVFTWPIAVGNFVLQQSGDLNPGGWTGVPATLDVVSGRNEVIVSPQTGDQFYRLELQ